jgi:ABC-2 type transport system ATP-binding protein
VRHRHGNNIFEVDFRGEREALIGALDSRCTLLDDGTAAEGIYNQVKIHVENDSDVRGVISLINQSVELRSFREIIPSMNDIFIKAVAGQLKTVEEK